MRPLHRPETRRSWDAIVCVSDWHRTTMIAAYGLDAARVSVLRNAIAPSFEGLFSDGDELARAKAARPVLSYASTPYRGLDVLLNHVFPEVRREFPAAELEVYSSMKVYQQGERGDLYAPLYEQCRQTPGVRYMGSVAQPALAEGLKRASILAYPSTFAETSCIAVMEAMAAGLMVVTTDLGALPETTRGFAALVPPLNGTGTVQQFARGFRDRLKDVLQRQADEPAAFAAARYEQVEAVNSADTWRSRAAAWEDAIRGWTTRRGSRHGADASASA
jgi:glycosyltransferase involved in cell wall biosynthesis